MDSKAVCSREEGGVEGSEFVVIVSGHGSRL